VSPKLIETIDPCFYPIYPMISSVKLLKLY